MADSYYVETWQPSGVKAEGGAIFDTFDAAVEWLRHRKQDDQGRILRMRAHLSRPQFESLSACGIELIG